MVDVAIIGAGPYGLSIAAHLKARGVDFRVFGTPMCTWRNHMPTGMKLKSEGFASSLYDPDSKFTLEQYCREVSLPYADSGLPVPLETFASYGMEFQRRLVPNLEDKSVTSVEPLSSGFRIGLSTGESLHARKVIAAIGLTHYAYTPPVFTNLSGELRTHSFAYGSTDHLKNREVAIVGAGASALDLAAVLRQAGAAVHVITRKFRIRFHDKPPVSRPLLHRLRFPKTTIGPGWSSLFCVRAPRIFRMFPEQYRLRFVREHLGPSGGWFVKDQLIGKVPFYLGVSVSDVATQNGRVQLRLTDPSNVESTVSADHVITATGYKVDLRRLNFLSSGVRDRIQSVEHTPVLSSHFESSIPGLYFVGASSSNTFGPLVRFACGAEFTAAHMSAHLERALVRTRSQRGSSQRVAAQHQDSDLANGHAQ